jgi:hypothetical protein
MSTDLPGISLKLFLPCILSGIYVLLERWRRERERERRGEERKREAGCSGEWMNGKIKKDITRHKAGLGNIALIGLPLLPPGNIQNLQFGSLASGGEEWQRQEAARQMRDGLLIASICPPDGPKVRTSWS